MPKIPRLRSNPLPLRLGHILITGSSRGIGRALAHALAPDAEQITLCARTDSDLAEVEQSLKSSSVRINRLVCDLTDFGAGVAFGREVQERFGEVDTLILNAGIAFDRDFAETKIAEVELELGVNYLAPLGLTQSLLPSLRARKQPRLVVISSLTAVVPFPGNATYAASKAALNAWVRTLALEERKLKTLVVLPGLTDTRLTKGKNSLLPSMTTSEVAGQVRTALRQGDRFLVPGRLNRFAHRFGRHLPDEFDLFVSATGKWLIPGWKDHDRE